MEFYGQFEHTIDDKSRLVLPAAYRAGFDKGGFATIRAGYVGLYPPGEWERERRRLTDVDRLPPRRLQQILGLTTPFTLDGQYRIALGTKLRDSVRPVPLGREVTVVGSGLHVAVYDRAAWEAVETDDETETLTDVLAGLDRL